jgi:hypothetical protein
VWWAAPPRAELERIGRELADLGLGNVALLVEIGVGRSVPR